MRGVVFLKKIARSIFPRSQLWDQMADTIGMREARVYEALKTDDVLVEMDTDKKGFRLTAVALHLTYRDHIPKLDYQAWLTTKYPFDEIFMAHENGQSDPKTPYAHTHVAVKFVKRLDVANPRAFDWGIPGVHPHIKFIDMRKPIQWINTVRYLGKEDPENVELINYKYDPSVDDKRCNISDIEALIAAVKREIKEVKSRLMYITEGHPEWEHLKECVKSLEKKEASYERRIGARLATNALVNHVQGCATLEQAFMYAEKPSDIMAIKTVFESKASQEYVPEVPEPLPWQQKLIKEVEYRLPASQKCRKIKFCVDTKGGIGKSVLADILEVTYGDQAKVFTVGSSRDVSCELAGIQKRGKPLPRIVVLDLARSYKERDVYGLIESMANGRITSTKFQTTTLRWKVDHVVVFANFMPDVSDETLSEDRWDIREFTRESDGSISERWVHPQEARRRRDEEEDAKFEAKMARTMKPHIV